MKSFVSHSFDELNDFTLRRTTYLENLYTNRKELVNEFSEKEKDGGIFDILLNPQTDAELDFCYAYLGFLDDKINLEDDIKNGRTKPIDIENSLAVLYVSTIAKAICNGDEFSCIDGTFYNLFSDFSRVLYKLTVLSKTDELPQIIAFRNGLSSELGGLDKSVMWFSINSICNSLINLMNNSKIFSEINRNRFDNEKLLSRFVDMADSFHEEYMSGVQISYNSSADAKNDSSHQFVKKEISAY